MATEAGVASSATESRRDTQDGSGRGPVPGEEELATKMLQIQSKRFYLDVKQNRRGRFLKIAEVGASGRKSRLLMSLAAATQFRVHLTDFGEYYVTLGPADAQSLPENGLLKSEVMVKENRRYFLDLKENSRGRFLRVTQTAVRGGGPRAQIALPAQGIIELRDALIELLDEYGKDDVSISPSQLPEGKQIRSENKMFYFDIGQNNRGIFMRISEVKSNFRTAVTIPERSWNKFRDYFIDVCSKMDSIEAGKGEGDKATGTAGSNAASTSSPSNGAAVMVVSEHEKQAE